MKIGSFLQVDVGPGKNSDGLYSTQRTKTVEEKDLCIRDLGYFSLGDFKEIEERDAFYILRLKVNVRVYEKNENMERFKAICIVKGYFLSLHDALRKQTQDVQQVLHRLFQMIEKNGHKSHWYEKKTVFDILGVVYEHTQRLHAVA
ncbi:hypothetical protein AM501_23290 [Aneurinibacillus migulanus]|nr:transposase [Aneurinibacillus migulanus]KIV54620.1 hypothetical protein TS64_16550 [Aneurinibacillus migulanus]KPD05968.1 hypothetical protein AM501_23290 [Aneurinibacillus migulanus]